MSRRPMKPSRPLRALVLALAMAAGLSGCSFSVFDLPLPGGASLGENPIEVHVEFRDVLDLVPKSTVKVADVDVGQVKEIALKDFHADVTIAIRRDTKLPENTFAEIRQTSLLGEKFVSLEAPSQGATGKLSNGDVIGLDRTGRNPEVEEVLGALSLVLNGGGIAQLKTIFSELNNALDGREPEVRQLLSTVDRFMGQLNDNRDSIVSALESVNNLAISLNKQKPALVAALNQLPASLKSLNGQRDDLVRMLKALDRLSGVATRVIRQSKGNTIATLRNLKPLLTQLRKSGDALPKSFSTLLTYPFVDQVVGVNPAQARSIHFGDYVNLDAKLDIDARNLQLPGLPGVPGVPDNPVTPTLNDIQKCLNATFDGNILPKSCRNLTAKQIKRLCAQAPNNPVCPALLDTLKQVTDGAGQVADSLTPVEKCLKSRDATSKACRNLGPKQIKKVCNQRPDSPLCNQLIRNLADETGSVPDILSGFLGGGGGGGGGGGDGGGLLGGGGSTLPRAPFGVHDTRIGQRDGDLAGLLLWGVSNP